MVNPINSGTTFNPTSLYQGGGAKEAPKKQDGTSTIDTATKDEGKQSCAQTCKWLLCLPVDIICRVFNGIYSAVRTVIYYATCKTCCKDAEPTNAELAANAKTTLEKINNNKTKAEDKKAAFANFTNYVGGKDKLCNAFVAQKITNKFGDDHSKVDGKKLADEENEAKKIFEESYKNQSKHAEVLETVQKHYEAKAEADKKPA